MSGLRTFVVSPTSILVSFEPGSEARHLRISDLSGYPSEQSLDGAGWRLEALAPGQERMRVNGLLPGHIYWFELGAGAAAGFSAMATAPPVATPWAGPASLPAAAPGHADRS